MSRREVVTFVDDYTGEDIRPEDARHLVFAVDGRQYEMDLSAMSRDAFDRAVAPFMAKARPFGRRSLSSPRTPAARAGVDSAEVRAWAVEQGLDVSRRGRLPGDVVAAFVAAQGVAS